MATHDYIMKIVPTMFENVNGHQLFPYQFTYAYRVSAIELKQHFLTGFILHADPGCFQ